MNKPEFIKLTESTSNEPIWINTSYIINISKNYDYADSTTITICLIGASTEIKVKQSAEQIVKQLSNEPYIL